MSSKPLPPELVKQFTAYSADHQDGRNKVCHAIGIPCIILGTTAILPTWLALILVVAYLVWTQRLFADVSMTLVAVFSLGLVLGLNAPTPWLAGLIAFGWAVQIYGHYAFEKKAPSFFSSLSQLLTGPMYYAAIVTGHWPPRTVADAQTAETAAPAEPAPPIDGDDGPTDR